MDTLADLVGSGMAGYCGCRGGRVYTFAPLVGCVGVGVGFFSRGRVVGVGFWIQPLVEQLGGNGL